MTKPLPALLSVHEVARRLSRPRCEVYDLIREGHLPAHRIGERLYRISEAALSAFIGCESVLKSPSRPCGTTSAASYSADPQLEAEMADVVATPHLPLPTELNPDLFKPTTPSVPSSDTLTIAFLMDEWLADARGRVRPKTYVSYEQMTRLHILPILGRWRVDQLDIRTIERFLQFKFQSGLSARSVQYIRALLRQAYNEAIRWGWLARNVAALARGPKAERPQFRVLSHSEARRLLASFADLRYGPIYITALGLGLRLGEVLGLRWPDVCLPNTRRKEELGQVTVRVQLQRVGGNWELVAPKSRSSIRSLSLPGFVSDALAKRQEQQRSERIELAGRWRNERGLVFTNRVGGPIDESRLRLRLSEHLKRNGFAHLRFHDLRHLSASLLLSQGTHPRVLMEILGHSQISLTLDTYCHVMPSAYPEVARSMENAVGQGTENAP